MTSDENRPPVPPEELPTELLSGAEGREPERIGPYVLVEKLGEGGMGEVWLADQAGPIRRRIAVKVIRRGMHSAELLARFEVERQALARMQHPNIARVLDAGTTEDGRPFFVMEHVDGMPLNAHCDHYRLGLRERLALFLQVCDGIQHAHQKAIVHRDLKPSNVLVAVENEQAVPKIIDFGIAKAIEGNEDDSTLTQVGHFLGTPEYMSPEQADPGEGDVDTRSDVYSLAAMLYELLTGALPFDSRELRRAALDEIRRRIREEAPPRPSVRVERLGDRATEAASRRSTDAGRLAALLRGDLDWIVMKGLEKERDRRYGSAAQLAADLRRHLERRPVEAGPPSAWYLLDRFVRRHRSAVAATAVVLVTLVGFSVATAAQARRIAFERNAAEREAARAEAINRLLTDTLAAAGPSVAAGRDATLLREILDHASERVRRGIEGGPEVEASVRHTLGLTYLDLGDLERAEEMLRAAEEAVGSAPDAAPSVRAGVDEGNGLVLLARGKPEEAAARFESVLFTRERELGPDHPDVAAALTNLALARYDLADYGDAAQLLRRSEAILRAAGAAHRARLGRTLASLAVALEVGGHREESVAPAREAFEIAREELGERHPSTMIASNTLAMQLLASGKPGEAAAVLEGQVATAREVLGEVHPTTVSYLNNLAGALWEDGRLDEAVTMYRENLDRARELHGPDHPDVLRLQNNFAGVLLDSGRPDLAEPLYSATLGARLGALGPDHPETLTSVNNMATLYRDTGRLELADPLYRKAREGFVRLLGPEHPSAVVAASNVGEVCNLRGRFAEGLEVNLEVLEAAQRVLPEGHPFIGLARRRVGDSLAGLGRFADAETELLAAFDALLAGHGAGHERTRSAAGSLAALYRAWGRPEDAERWTAAASG